MKKTWALLSLVVIIFLCSFTVVEWVDFQNTDGRFRVKFPKQPEESEQPVNTDEGSVNMKMFMYDVGKFKDDNTLYAVAYADYPDTLISSDFKDRIVNDFFKNAITTADSNLNGKVISEHKISFKNYPGRQIKISYMDGQAVMNMKMYLVKSRMYLLEVGCEAPKDNNTSIDRFFFSFELLNDNSRTGLR